MNNTNNKYFTVFSLRVANYLINNGFELKSTGINLAKPQYKVFFFENTSDLKLAIQKANELS